METRNEYGAPTKEFVAAMKPHEAALDKAVRELTTAGYRDAEVYQALVDYVSLLFVTRRLAKGAKKHQQEKKATRAARFDETFAAAREAGCKEFQFEGKRYHTRHAGEV